MQKFGSAPTKALAATLLDKLRQLHAHPELISTESHKTKI